MNTLTNEQIAYIRRDIRAKGIRSAELEEDILDHLCCITEDAMIKGIAFGAAYASALAAFGPNGLCKVQEEREYMLSTRRKLEERLSAALNYTMTFIYLITALFFVSAPITLSIVLFDLSFILMFWPLVIMGAYICIKRINYRKFELIQFKESIMPF
jgi:hypothetical protein